MDRYVVKVAEGVQERHSRTCGKSTSTSPKRRPCTCTPSFRARRQVAGVWTTETFSTLGDAVAWREQPTSRTAGPARQVQATSLRTLAESFAVRARDGRTLTRS